MKFLLFISFLSLQISAWAQYGTIRGQIIDDETGESLIGVNVVIDGTTNGTSTDLDGGFNLKVEAGTYSISCSYISYATLKVADIVVKGGEVNNLGELRLKTDAILTETVVITATRSRNNETAMVTMQKKSSNVIDGISSQTFKKVGDSDAGAAIKRVTGVSVQDGKYVFVRGLGDRYSKTTLNGMEVPGLDPDRNSIQLDIFPTNLIDNLTVVKTFSPEFSGDFTGGLIDITTKDFPEEKQMSVSADLGYTVGMNLNSDFLTYESDNSDLYAMGAESRELPIARDVETGGLRNPEPFGDPKLLYELTDAFDKNLATSRQMSFLNHGFTFGAGNQYNKDGYTLGLNFSTSYSRKYTYYDDMLFSEYGTDRDNSINDLLLVKKDSGEVGYDEVFWSAFVSGAYKRENTSVSISLMNLQNGIKQSSLLNGRETGEVNAQDNRTQSHVLYYNQRSISNALLEIKQYIPSKNIEISFKTSPTLALNKEPDFRQTVFELDGPRVKIAGGNGGLVQRIYRNMEEVSFGNRLDAKYDFKVWNDLKSSLKVGGAYNYKERDFDIATYGFRESPIRVDYNLDPNEILEDDNIFDPVTRTGVFVQGVEQENNIYQANSTNLAAYISNELPINNLIKFVYGLRLETFEIRYTGQKFQITDLEEDVFDNEVVLDETNLLPSAGFIYNFMDNVNLRLNYSQTVARPTFKEKSEALIVDALTGRTFVGNLELEQSEIQNFDIRLEKFYPQGQLISLSGFYKYFVNPIELVAYSQNATSTFTPRNSSDATLIGAEFDFRKNLQFISESLDQFSLGTNLTYVYSRIDRRKIISPGDDNKLGTDDDISEYDERVQNKRDTETIDKYRELQGQAPFVINTYINYKNDSLGLECNLSYNVQGKKLSVVGVARYPSVYEQPFHSLNFKASKTIGSDRRSNLSFTVTNILDDKREFLYEAYGTDKENFTSYSPRQTFELGYSYKF